MCEAGYQADRRLSQCFWAAITLMLLMLLARCAHAPSLSVLLVHLARAPADWLRFWYLLLDTCDIISAMLFWFLDLCCVCISSVGLWLTCSL